MVVWPSFAPHPLAIGGGAEAPPFLYFFATHSQPVRGVVGLVAQLLARLIGAAETAVAGAFQVVQR